MARKTDALESEDDLRPEYDFSKMRTVGRGIYAKRFRSGTILALLNRVVREAFSADQSVNEALRVIAKAAKQQVSRARKAPVRAKRQSSRMRRTRIRSKE
jgi:hypothetical protein